MKEVYEDAINYLKYYGEKNDEKIERISYFLEKELKNYIKLQSNWNSLREYVEKRIQDCKRYYPCCSEEFQHLLDKTNELEGE